MDAKFRTRWTHEELPLVLEALVHRGYQRDNDRVFILQPSPAALKRRTWPLAWGKTCDYGQDSPTSHATGAFQLGYDTSGIPSF